MLWMVEALFRTVKSVLETRPIYHKCDETIRGHVFCSFLALVMMRELQERMDDKRCCQRRMGRRAPRFGFTHRDRGRLRGRPSFSYPQREPWLVRQSVPSHWSRDATKLQDRIVMTVQTISVSFPNVVVKTFHVPHCTEIVQL